MNNTYIIQKLNNKGINGWNITSYLEVLDALILGIVFTDHKVNPANVSYYWVDLVLVHGFDWYPITSEFELFNMKDVLMNATSEFVAGAS